MIRGKKYSQILRYAVVGLLSNLILYILYLGATWFGMSAAYAMTITYSIGVAQSFLLNKNWTFSYVGYAGRAFVRYCLCYLAGYLLNLIALYVFVDLFFWSHRVVQACMIFVVAAFLFFLQKTWVFRK